jgi:hypothetical protein
MIRMLMERKFSGLEMLAQACGAALIIAFGSRAALAAIVLIGAAMDAEIRYHNRKGEQG